jgi:hypothetical protein
LGRLAQARYHAVAASIGWQGAPTPTASPTVVLYFSDFDPSGRHMPVAVSRKLQTLCDLRFPALDICGLSRGAELERRWLAADRAWWRSARRDMEAHPLYAETRETQAPILDDAAE